ncbi:MAG: flagellar basal body rod protein FlgB [Planctomycetota bacterium]
MSKINSVVDFLDAGIKAEQVRQKVIANNIANLQTPEYRTIDIKFEELLSKALTTEGKVDTEEISPEFYLPGVTPLKSNGNDVNLEAEVGKMVKNSLKHKTYIRLLKKLYDQMNLAINVK